MTSLDKDEQKQRLELDLPQVFFITLTNLKLEVMNMLIIESVTLE
jgi:hypothetical protein